MRFIKVKSVKLGNMRVAKDWTVTPSTEIKEGIVTMQSDNRIARVNLNTATAVLSNGKGGHQGFMQLSPALGATTVAVPAEVVAKVRESVAGRADYASGTVVVVG